MSGEFVIPNDPLDLWSEDTSNQQLTLVVSDHSLDFSDENTIVHYSEGACATVNCRLPVPNLTFSLYRDFVRPVWR